MTHRWWPGNAVRLLENGEQYFPAVFEAIAAAEREVVIETFILFEDEVGRALHRELVRAARRGVQVDLMVDGFGSADLSPGFVAGLAAAGVRVRTFDPSVRVLGVRLNVLRRMHRKLVVVDGRVAFVGGINFSADHLADFGPQAKQDYAVRVEGPVVRDIHRFTRAALRSPAGVVLPAAEPDRPARGTGGAEARFVHRDNLKHRSDIERFYRLAIRGARHQVLIANAYFFPGHRLLRDLRRAARRGVDVRLILQGEPDVPLARTAASLLYESLQRAGVRIFEYCERPLHGKVAVVDDEWATVGSSNLDPLSLSLNLEANLVLRDPRFARELRHHLDGLMARACQEVVPAAAPSGPSWWHQLRGFVVFHVLRRFPVWATRLPAHSPTLALLRPRSPADTPAPRAPRVAGARHGR